MRADITAVLAAVVAPSSDLRFLLLQLIPMRTLFPSHTTTLSARIAKSRLRLVLFLVCMLMWRLPGCGSSTPEPADTGHAENDGGGAPDAAPPVVNPRDVPLDPERTPKVAVYSNPLGCIVFVDLVPVLSDNGGLALTPCEFPVPRGTHSISVEKPGGKRSTQQVDVQSNRELEFDVSSSPIDLDDPSILNAPLFEAAVGRSIPLATLNSPGRDFDPFLTSDGRTIYFVSDRDGLRGVYTATRPTPYHDFDEPRIIMASSGADLPVSPSVSSDGLILVYGVADKSRLWQLTRDSIDARFDNKEITRSDDRTERAWRSSQLSGDGLKLFWTEDADADDALVTRAAVRATTGKLFGKTLAFDVPGGHPHISTDGLRQFSFDGTTLRRFRRGSVRQPFGPPEVVAELEPKDYAESPRHRQFWVTDDEQWLVYCDNPRAAGDLFVMRLSDGPGWGRSFLGKPVPNKMEIANVEPEEKPKPEPVPTDTVDPRTLPLPYTTHWDKFVKLLEANKGDEATALVKQAQGRKEFGNDRELLAWDLQLADALTTIDREVLQGVQELKAGAPIRVGGTRFDFDRLDGETLHVKLKDKELTRKLTDLSPGERISLADAGPEKAEGAKALRFATYLFFQGKLYQTLADGWFKRAGDEASQFHERLAARVLHQGKAELARGNLGAGITFLDAVASVAGPDTDAAKRAAKQRETLYDAVEWKPVGPRKWKQGEQGEFTADFVRSNGSYLVSDEKYGDFEFSCEWRVTEPGAMGGVFLRYSGNGNPLENGAKIHLANDPKLPKMDRFATGALFAVASPSVNASLPAGEWNSLRIQARGSNVKVWINGTEVLQTTLAKEVPPRGSIMLDGAVGGIGYRKILLYELITPTGDQPPAN
jgi:hypothetical protein